jgi:DNA-binding XRE family transcriptional regulator
MQSTLDASRASENRYASVFTRSLRQAREASDINIETVAQKIGVEPTVLSDIERGAIPLGVEEFIESCWAIGRDPLELFTQGMQGFTPAEAYRLRTSPLTRKRIGAFERGTERPSLTEAVELAWAIEIDPVEMMRKTIASAVRGPM